MDTNYATTIWDGIPVLFCRGSDPKPAPHEEADRLRRSWRLS